MQIADPARTLRGFSPLPARAEDLHEARVAGERPLRDGPDAVDGQRRRSPVFPGGSLLLRDPEPAFSKYFSFLFVKTQFKIVMF